MKNEYYKINSTTIIMTTIITTTTTTTRMNGKFEIREGEAGSTRKMGNEMGSTRMRRD